MTIKIGCKDRHYFVILNVMDKIVSDILFFNVNIFLYLLQVYAEQKQILLEDNLPRIV
ncbi:hypothetical protein [Riemerella columbipharyngis]|uniref:hypothetical protein n=1 Tax=Riemerella columbipharyngis TaxID=1071918 RepID=UPI0015A188D5|nr:hypothetical protein [Riemerella columbipharyngis]